MFDFHLYRLTKRFALTDYKFKVLFQDKIIFLTNFFVDTRSSDFERSS